MAHGSAVAPHAVRAGFWSVNGCKVNNPFLQVFVGDFLAPLGDPSAVVGGWGALYNQLSLLKYRRHLQLQALADQPLALCVDTPPFLEVDEATTLAILLYEPRGVDLLLDPQVAAAPYLTARMYNWKYTV